MSNMTKSTIVRSYIYFIVIWNIVLLFEEDNKITNIIGYFICLLAIVNTITDVFLFSYKAEWGYDKKIGYLNLSKYLI